MKTPTTGRVAPCSAPKMLSKLDQGELTESEVDEFVDHLSGCATCAEAVAWQGEASDPLLDELASLPDQDDDEVEYRQLYHSLMSNRWVDALPQDAPRAIARTLAEEDCVPLQTCDSDSYPPLSLPSLLGKYLLEARIGQGSYGVVYRARHVHLDQLAAVKVLNAARLGGAAVVGRFLDEMKAVGGLVHPCIIRATDAGEDAGRHYLVMEYIEGVDAARLLHTAGRLPIAEACEIVRQAALGLDFIHRQGLVHRDVKPSNLLVTLDGQVKLLDLGLALRRDATRRGELLSQSPLGTAEFMPPEQWNRSSAVDPRADLYSLGCTLYKLLTCRSPFGDAAADGATLRRLHCEQTPRRLGGELRHVPRALERLCQRLLAKDPENRPTDAFEVAKALVPLARGADLRALLAPLAPSPALQREANGPSPRTALPPKVSRRTLLTGGLGAAGLMAIWGMRRRTPQLDRGRWRPLGPAEPELLFSLGETPAATWQFDQVSRQGSLASSGLSLLQFGRPVAGPWQLAIELRQEPLEARSGIFFQWRVLDEDDKWKRRFQSVEVVRRSVGGLDARLIWSQWEIHAATDSAESPSNGRVSLGSFAVVPKSWAETPVQLTDPSRPQSMQLTLGRRGFPEVIWNGVLQDVNGWKLSEEGRRQQTLAPSLLVDASLGRLGLMNLGGATKFFHPQLNYLEV